jgi:hypothetical protein
MSGTGAATDETGTGVTEEELMERRANNVPTNSAITMRGVINRSGMEPVAGKVRQGCEAMNQNGSLSLAIYCIANIRRPVSGRHHSLRRIHGTAKSDRPIFEVRLS